MIWCSSLAGPVSQHFSVDIKTFDNLAAADAKVKWGKKFNIKSERERKPVMLSLLIMLPEMSLCHQIELHDR